MVSPALAFSKRCMAMANSSAERRPSLSTSDNSLCMCVCVCVCVCVRASVCTCTWSGTYKLRGCSLEYLHNIQMYMNTMPCTSVLICNANSTHIHPDHTTNIYVYMHKHNPVVASYPGYNIYVEKLKRLGYEATKVANDMQNVVNIHVLV